jgi:hypothetical protein
LEERNLLLCIINTNAVSLRVEMVNPNRFYTYAYLREDRTPYYIGKGQTNRIYQKNGKPCGVPKDKSRIIFLKKNLTEEEAFKHEKYMISVFNRKDLGTGILHNRTDGGDGSSGWIMPDEVKKKISKIQKGNKNCLGREMSEETRKKISIANTGKTSYWKGKKLPKDIVDKMKQNLSCRKGVANGRAKKYLITFDDGHTECIKSLQTWAREHEYSPSSIRNLYNGRQTTAHKNIIKVIPL